MRGASSERHAEKRLQILSAASRCFLRHGLRGASISNICAEAQISPGHLYHYFPGKDAIIEAMARVYLEGVQASLADAGDGRSPVERLRYELHRNEEWSEAGSCNILFDLIAEAGRSPAISTILRESSDAVRAIIVDVVRSGQRDGTIDAGLDPDDAAIIVMGIMDAALVAPVRHGGADPEGIRALFATMISRFLEPARS